jgi:hypothetical protein
MSSYGQRMMDAITYEGPSRLRKAWLMASASYSYTRSHDGAVINDAGDTISFSRWYAFKGGTVLFWKYLWTK